MHCIGSWRSNRTKKHPWGFLDSSAQSNNEPPKRLHFNLRWLLPLQHSIWALRLHSVPFSIEIAGSQLISCVWLSSLWWSSGAFDTPWRGICWHSWEAIAIGVVEKWLGRKGCAVQRLETLSGIWKRRFVSKFQASVFSCSIITNLRGKIKLKLRQSKKIKAKRLLLPWKDGRLKIPLIPYVEVCVRGSLRRCRLSHAPNTRLGSDFPSRLINPAMKITS